MKNRPNTALVLANANINTLVDISSICRTWATVIPSIEIYTVDITGHKPHIEAIWENIVWHDISGINTEDIDFSAFPIVLSLDWESSKLVTNTNTWHIAIVADTADYYSDFPEALSARPDILFYYTGANTPLHNHKHRHTLLPISISQKYPSKLTIPKKKKIILWHSGEIDSFHKTKYILETALAEDIDVDIVLARDKNVSISSLSRYPNICIKNKSNIDILEEIASGSLMIYESSSIWSKEIYTSLMIDKPVAILEPSEYWEKVDSISTILYNDHKKLADMMNNMIISPPNTNKHTLKKMVEKYGLESMLEKVNDIL